MFRHVQLKIPWPILISNNKIQFIDIRANVSRGLNILIEKQKFW